MITALAVWLAWTCGLVAGMWWTGRAVEALDREIALLTRALRDRWDADEPEDPRAMNVDAAIVARARARGPVYKSEGDMLVPLVGLDALGDLWPDDVR